MMETVRSSEMLVIFFIYQKYKYLQLYLRLFWVRSTSGTVYKKVVRIQKHITKLRNK